MITALDFTGQLVVITGVGRAGQVGEAIAQGFADRGATLALLDLQQSEVDARCATLRAQGHTAFGYAANLSDGVAAADVAARLATETQAQFGGVHAVICVAGGFGATGALDSTDVAQWQKQFMINLDTAYHATRAFLPAVRAAHGAFVYFGSVAALPSGNPAGLAAYSAAKSGVLALMRAVAVDEREHGVRANAVAPTQVRTAANVNSMGSDLRYVERESVADVVAFLASPLARNVSGEVIKLA
jgi:NAD(P)-dependent dehydrogenase (short-subunit alcohol dehydrogenase family)